MKRNNRIPSPIAFTFLGLAVFRATADEPAVGPQPKLIQAKQPQLITAKPHRTFGNLLYKGQTVTLDRLRHEFQAGYYVGFERNGIETFRRLSSIHSIAYGVELAGE